MNAQVAPADLQARTAAAPTPATVRTVRLRHDFAGQVHLRIGDHVLTVTITNTPVAAPAAATPPPPPEQLVRRAEVRQPAAAVPAPAAEALLAATADLPAAAPLRSGGNPTCWEICTKKNRKKECIRWATVCHEITVGTHG